MCKTERPIRLPALPELGIDLLQITARQRAISLAAPIFWCAAYFVFALFDHWVWALLALIALSFVTYGSVSHDLVHRNLGLSRRWNDLCLCAIELLMLRSGHAYQAAHLHHHARFPHDDDIEAARANRSLTGALIEGIVGQFRIGIWAMRRPNAARTWIIAEQITIAGLVIFSFVSLWFTPIFAIYSATLIMGSWIIPLATSYFPHDPNADEFLLQTRAYRGIVASVVAVQHLYHLEHHLYPAVPHHHWPELAARLDPFFAKAGVKPIRFWF
jgi:beta-carotene hydroxylase